ncbi:hypothetical protein FB451DRAFT_372155 [Mycena latifolia]|nr:hypothetical protein FB451DRAFT_372155 [Mycena latifolia]
MTRAARHVWGTRPAAGIAHDVRREYANAWKDEGGRLDATVADTRQRRVRRPGRDGSEIRGRVFGLDRRRLGGTRWDETRRDESRLLPPSAAFNIVAPVVFSPSPPSASRLDPPPSIHPSIHLLALISVATPHIRGVGPCCCSRRLAPVLLFFAAASPGRLFDGHPSPPLVATRSVAHSDAPDPHSDAWPLTTTSPRVQVPSRLSAPRGSSPPPGPALPVGSTVDAGACHRHL